MPSLNHMAYTVQKSAILIDMKTYKFCLCNNTTLKKQNAILIETLVKIARWEMPDTGRFYPDGTQIRYSVLYGSNGEQSHIVSLAEAALENTGHPQP